MPRLSASGAEPATTAQARRRTSASGRGGAAQRSPWRDRELVPLWLEFRGELRPAAGGCPCRRVSGPARRGVRGAAFSCEAGPPAAATTSRARRRAASSHALAAWSATAKLRPHRGGRPRLHSTRPRCTPRRAGRIRRGGSRRWRDRRAGSTGPPRSCSGMERSRASPGTRRRCRPRRTRTRRTPRPTSSQPRRRCRLPAPQSKTCPGDRASTWRHRAGTMCRPGRSSTSSLETRG